MTERQKSITQWLFWGAFGVFLGVSIPHIAWVVRQYMPLNVQGPEDWGYNTLSIGYAIAIDGIMAWLTHAQSAHHTREKWLSFSRLFTWTFIIALVLMSWYLNWVYNIAHDPSGNITNVWGILLTNQWGYIPEITVGEFTPLLLAALPVFTIAYVGVLNNVNHLKAQAAKSIDELESEALEAERRAVAQRRIREAQKNASTAVDIFGASESLIKGAARLRKTMGDELVRDTQQEHLTKVLKLFRDTPALLNEENATLAETAIKQTLKLKRKDDDVARFWRLKAAQIISSQPTTPEPAPLSVEVEVTPTTTTLLQEELSIPEPQNPITPSMATTPLPESVYEPELVAEVHSNPPAPFTDEFMDEHFDDEDDRELDEHTAYPITGTLTNNSLLAQSARNGQSTGRKGAYAITKELAAIQTGRTLPDIDSAIKDGQLKTFAKDRNKILVSSLENWHSSEKRVKRSSSKLEAVTKP